MNAYGCDGMTSADCERAMGLHRDQIADDRERRREAREEIASGRAPWEEFLAKQDHETLAELASNLAAAQVMTGPKDEALRAECRATACRIVDRLVQDYIDERVSA